MLREFKFSDARKNLTAIIDQVQTNLPIVIKHRKASEKDALIIPKDMLEELISAKFEPKQFKEKDGSITLALEYLGLAANAENKKKASEELVDDAVEYAKEYMDNRVLYYNSPNRKAHFPYILRILLCEDRKQVKELLGLAKI